MAITTYDSTPSDDRLLAALVDIEHPTESDRHFWTGSRELFVDGNIYDGLGACVGFSGSETTIGEPDSQITLTFNAVLDEYRGFFLTPIGHLLTTIRLSTSDNHGRDWTILPSLRRVGYTSNPRLQGPLYLVDVVHPYQVVFRRRARLWSNADQQRREPGDTAFDQMHEIASGLEIRWPRVADFESGTSPPVDASTDRVPPPTRNPFGK